MGTPPPQLPAALAWGRAGVPSCAGRFQRNVSFLSLPAPLGGGRPRVNAGCAPGPGAGGPRVGERCLFGAAWPAPSALGRGPSRGGSVKSPPGVGIGGGGGAWRGAFGCWGAEGSPILLSRCVPSSGPQPVSLRFWLFLGKCPQVSRFPRPGFRSCLPLCVSLHVPGFWKSSRVCQVGLGLCLSVPLLLWGGGWRASMSERKGPWESAPCKPSLYMQMRGLEEGGPGRDREFLGGARRAGTQGL